jgi:K+-sensing histidine kinase KdpD
MLSGLQANTSNFALARDYTKVATVIALITVVGQFAPLSYHALGYVYLFGVIALSPSISRWPALAAAILSGAAWDFFFVPPKLSFSGIHFDEGLLLTTYFAVALIGSQLTALRASAHRAELFAESERMHQTLLDSVSHEMMTPLAVFRSSLEQLGTPDPARRDQVIVELKVATQRLDRLVSNLLNQNRLESGVLRPNVDWCDCHELIVAARRTAGGKIGDHPLTLNIPIDLPIFRADAALMEQVISQLLVNAAVHTPPGTVIRVDAVLSGDSTKVLITVSDNGLGVPEEIRDSVFDKFTRGQNARKGGLGLGLSIVKGFMHAQGGEVSVESPPGGGARFTLSLPYEKSDSIPVE